MPTPFDSLLFNDLQSRLVAPSEATKSAALFVAGDHWQDGAAWTGPSPDPSERNAREVIARIRREFVSSNVIGEIVARHRDGVIGREPRWAMTVRRGLADGEEPASNEVALLTEADAALTAWWDAHGVHGTIARAIATALVYGRAVVRVFVPPDDVADDVIPHRDTLADALDLMWLDVPDPAQAVVQRDPRSMRLLGVYTYTDDENNKRAELTFIDGIDTVMRVVSDDAVLDETRLPLAGHVLMCEIMLPSLVTLQLQQLQQSLNMTLTMMQHNVVISGFVERVLANAQMPFDEVDDPTTPGNKKRIYKPYEIGPGKTTALVGVPVKNERGETTGYSSPSIQWRDPVDVSTFIKTDDALYARMLKESRQLHALLSGDAVASGESRKQAMLDFVMSLTPTAAAVALLTRWVLETCLYLAAHFCGRGQAFDGLRADVSPRLWLGSLSADDRRFLLEAYKEGVLSRETVIGLLDVDDVDAEIARITAEQDAKAQQQTTTLASALLAQQRRMDSGAASNGLEQPLSR